MKKVLFVALGLLVGLAAAAFSPALVAQVASSFGNAAAEQPNKDKHSEADGHAETDGHAEGGEEDGHGHEEAGQGHEGEEGVVHLTEEQISGAGITTAPVSGGELVKTLAVPGTVTAESNRLAHVASKVSGTLKEIRKQLGDPVEAGEVVALVESREIAEAKSEFLAALRAEKLVRTTFEREKGLWEKRISAQQDFLEAQNTAEEAQIRLDLARQRLAALGLLMPEIEALPGQASADLRVQEVRAQIAGHVIDRSAVLGEFIEANADLLTVADTANLWVEMSVPPADVHWIQKGHRVAVSNPSGITGEAQIVFVSPVVDADTRSVRVIAAMTNDDHRWRLGDFVTARIRTEAHPVDVMVPREAVQKVEGESVVFVRTEEGFEKREIVLGKSDETSAEVVFGLDPGEIIAVGSTFVLKAEFGKSEAEHAH